MGGGAWWCWVYQHKSFFLHGVVVKLPVSLLLPSTRDINCLMHNDKKLPHGFMGCVHD